jgi:hypothetical protein
MKLPTRLDLSLNFRPRADSRRRGSATTATASVTDLIVRAGASAGAGREDIWSGIIDQLQASRVLELGVLRGAFAEQLLRRCPDIERYYMLDPWRHLDDWNKPSNFDQPAFDEYFALAMQRTEFAAERRIVLRGKTTEVIDEIPDEGLDLAYVDGDHTLHGTTIDLIRTYPKVRPGGVLGGDDYTPTIWQHSEDYEPSLVCPFAAYFAESQQAPLVILPHGQFAIVKPAEPGNHFRVIDTTGAYGPRSLLWQVRKRV